MKAIQQFPKIHKLKSKKNPKIAKYASKKIQKTTIIPDYSAKI
jgi:hypothetical protein